MLSFFKFYDCYRKKSHNVKIKFLIICNNNYV